MKCMDMIKLYNVHALVHLSDDASHFGALENIFHFTYETFLHYLSLNIFLNVKFVRYSVFCLSLQIYNENTDDIKIILLLNVYLTCNDYIKMRGGSVYFS